MTQGTCPAPDPMPEPDPADPAPGPTVSVRRTSVDRIIDTLLRQMSPSEVTWQLIALRPHAVFNALLAIVQLPYATMLRTESVGDGMGSPRPAWTAPDRVARTPSARSSCTSTPPQTEATAHGQPLPIAQQSLFTMSDVPDAQRLLDGIVGDAERYGVRVVTSKVGTPLPVGSTG